MKVGEGYMVHTRYELEVMHDLEVADNIKRGGLKVRRFNTQLELYIGSSVRDVAAWTSNQDRHSKKTRRKGPDSFSLNNPDHSIRIYVIHI